MTEKAKLKYAELTDEEAVQLMRRKMLEMKNLLLEIKELLKIAIGES
ncbi:MAG: hypothetical protein NDF56_04640 [archaeon GB-1845-036]|nr:hypothetical protein [Candidatus Verstraetearchaeota archaeon]MCS7374247.1 hypothetical protein [Candidatus Culexmicrobium thermophilum]